MSFANKIKDLFSFPKLYSVFCAFLACCVHLMKLFAFDEVVLEKKRFEAKVDGNANA
jgi:hypothetical protein